MIIGVHVITDKVVPDKPKGEHRRLSMSFILSFIHYTYSPSSGWPLPESWRSSAPVETASLKTAHSGKKVNTLLLYSKPFFLCKHSETMKEVQK